MLSSFALSLLGLQIILGGLDNILHHELTELLPSRLSARRELKLHALREALYGALFLTFAWVEPFGLFALCVIVVLFAEVGVTLLDFLEEDRSRKLPGFERVLHTVLALIYGAFLAAIVPELLFRMFEPSSLAASDLGVWSWVLTACALGVWGFAVRNAMAVYAMSTPPTCFDEVPANGRTTLVIGGTGFIGRELVERLIKRGERVILLVRDARQSKALFQDRVLHIEDLGALPAETCIDAVVNLAGAPVIGLPWIRQRRRALWQSRVDLTEHVISRLMCLEARPKVFVHASAIGYYGDRENHFCEESHPAGDGFAAELCAATEATGEKIEVYGVRRVSLRIGLVLDRSGGALPLMALPIRLGFGGVLGVGRQWMSWITLGDLLRMIVEAIDNAQWRGAINAVAPEPVRHADFQKAAARVLGRPMWFRIPSVLLKILLGEMSSIFLYSQRVVPKKALALGFAFDSCWAHDALSALLGARPPQEAVVRSRLQSARTLATSSDDLREIKGAFAHEFDHSRRAAVALRSQSAGGASRKGA